MDLGVVFIIVGLGLLMFLAFNRVNILLASILCSMVIVLANGMPVIATLSENYMSGFGSFITSNYLIFAFSALFGKVMEETGAAKAFAYLICRGFSDRYAIYACILATGLLCYGGVSVFVIVFAVYPIFVECFKRADLPARLLPGAIAFMPFTCASACFPGAPAINNILPTQYLGTTLMAAPVVGIIAGVFMMVFGFFYLEHEIRKAKKSGEGFVANAVMLAQIEKEERSGHIVTSTDQILSIVPIISLIVLINVLHLTVWVAMILVIVGTILIFWKNVSGKINMVNLGIAGSVAAIINTASVVGFGTVIKATPGFQVIIDSIASMGGTPMISLALSTTLIAGVTGSGSGGVGTALSVLTERYLAMGVQPQIFHRIVSVASTGLDSLPHNSAVITLLSVCGFTHKEGYKAIFMLTVVNSLLALVVTVALGYMFYPLL